MDFSEEGLMGACPCGSGSDYGGCCGLYLEGGRKAPTAEALMRSRYTAFTLARMDYITETHDPETLDQYDEEQAREWAEGSEWLGLTIRATEGGGADDTRGIVEFVARYRADDGEQEHREKSVFMKRDGAWYFHDGRVLGAPSVRAEKRPGRNDPCSCGSGKKYKKCCGRN